MSQSLNPAKTNLGPTTARGPLAGGLVVALLLHAAIVAVTFVTWQHKLEIADESSPTVPVDLVTVADKTNIAPSVAPQPPATPPPPDTAPPPPPPAVAEALPQPDITPKPEPMPTPTVKPQPAPDQKKPKPDDIDKIIGRLAAPVVPPRNLPVRDRPMPGIGDMNAMNADLQSEIKSQMERCWTPPNGAPHPERLVPFFRIQLNRDGSVVGQPQLSAQSAAVAASDPFMRAAAESARRAILECGPYKLPPGRYDQWRDFTIDFNPRDIVQ